MGQTLTSITLHIIFSTKGRTPSINSELKQDLMAYMGGIVRELKGEPLIINGISDHVHMLIEIPPTISTSDFMRVVKTNSSKWVHQNYGLKTFAWQDGYGAFSVSKSGIPAVFDYIKDQEQHHKKRSFQEELIAFLHKYTISYDDRYLWE